MEAFFRTHQYLIEHVKAPVRRALMDEINWTDRLIGIKGCRGIGKTTFLLQYAKEQFRGDRSCLYVNMNNFYFLANTLIDFVEKFTENGGKVLLIDQVFKYPNWSQELRACYDKYPTLKIVFTGSSVMRLKDENLELSGVVHSYNLNGFSFREYLNLMTGQQLRAFTLDEILTRHEQLARGILAKVNPIDYFQDYLHHGFFPFFLEKRNFSENLLKTMNMMLEVDVLLIKQIELKYLVKIKKLLYLLSVNAPIAPNVSKLANDIQTSRATVMNYMKYLADARLITMIYPKGESFPKKPSKIFLHNSNLIYAIYPIQANEQDVLDTFFLNAFTSGYTINKGEKINPFIVNGTFPFRVCGGDSRIKKSASVYYAMHQQQIGKDNMIPLWLFGFLY